MANRQQCFGKPFAAVGADLSCPHIRKHPQNGNPFAGVGSDLSCPHIRMYPQNGNPSAMFWQTVRRRRVRFIAPAYMKTPTKWGRKCACGEMKIHI
ncbi:hypothetical protein [Prevotella pallens]